MNESRQQHIVTINNQTIEYSLLGEGSTTLVFLNGFRMNMNSWGSIQKDLNHCGRILFYNRTGVGNSSKAKCAQTGDVVTNTLRALLHKLNLQPPFVLVAHSFGGLFANLFARRFPSETKAVAFVESSHPEELTLQKKFKPPFILNLLNEGIKNVERIFDRHKYSEDEYASFTVQQIEQAGEFPQIPVIIVSGAKRMPFVPHASFDIHLQCQRKLLGLSSQSRQFIAEKSGHFPQVTQAKFVVEAIQYLIQDKSSQFP